MIADIAMMLPVCRGRLMRLASASRPAAGWRRSTGDAAHARLGFIIDYRRAPPLPRLSLAGEIAAEFSRHYSITRHFVAAIGDFRRCFYCSDDFGLMPIFRFSWRDCLLGWLRCDAEAELYVGFGQRATAVPPQACYRPAARRRLDIRRACCVRCWADAGSLCRFSQGFIG